MKRSLITTLVIGVAVAIVVGALHATKAIAGFEAGVAQLVSDYAGATRVVGEKWQYIFVLLIAAGVAWLSLRNLPRDGRETTLFGFLLVELLVLSWVCSLYRVFFQPVPCIFAVALAVAFAEGWTALFAEGPLAFSAHNLCQSPLEKRISSCQQRAIRWQAKVYEASVVRLRHCQSTWIDEFI